MGARLVAGIFVGGESRRMGSTKGLLPVGTTTIVQRTLAIFDALGIDVVLVGDRDEYRRLGRTAIADIGTPIGPLGGLVALLRHARGGHAIAIACDMPFVAPALVERLCAEHPGAAAVAARRGDRWEPLFARYHADAVLALAERHVSSGRHSLQVLLDAAGARALALSPDEERQLDDWDTPDDIAGPR